MGPSAIQILTDYQDAEAAAAKLNLPKLPLLGAIYEPISTGFGLALMELAGLKGHAEPANSNHQVKVIRVFCGALSGPIVIELETSWGRGDHLAYIPLAEIHSRFRPVNNVACLTVEEPR